MVEKKGDHYKSITRRRFLDLAAVEIPTSLCLALVMTSCQGQSSSKRSPELSPTKEQLKHALEATFERKGLSLEVQVQQADEENYISNLDDEMPIYFLPLEVSGEENPYLLTFFQAKKGVFCNSYVTISSRDSHEKSSWHVFFYKITEGYLANKISIQDGLSEEKMINDLDSNQSATINIGGFYALFIPEEFGPDNATH